MNSADYERFVFEICRDLAEGQHVTIHRKKKYLGKVSGREIEIDASFEARILGAEILGLIECKCYKSRVEVSDVEEFHSKLDDIGAHKGVIFTTIGYDPGAFKVAQGRGIALFVIAAGAPLKTLRIETKSLSRSSTAGLLKGTLFPWGNFDAGLGVENADDFFRGLAFSEPEKYEKLYSAGGAVGLGRLQARML